MNPIQHPTLRNCQTAAVCWHFSWNPLETRQVAPNSSPSLLENALKDIERQCSGCFSSTTRFSRSWFWQKLFTLLQDPKLIGEAYLIAILELLFLIDMGHCTAQGGDREMRKNNFIRKKKRTYRPKNSQIILKHLHISSKTRTSISDFFCVVISLSRSLHCQFTGSILQSTVFAWALFEHDWLTLYVHDAGLSNSFCWLRSRSLVVV